MIKYPIFYRQFITRRMGDLARINNFETFNELPLGSVIHTASGLYNGFNKKADVTPDPAIYQRYFSNKKVNYLFIRSLPTEDDLIQPDMKAVRVVLANTDVDIRKFRSADVSKRFLVTDPMSFSYSNIYTNAICHDPLFKAVVTGIRTELRMFHICLASMLNNIIKSPGFDHYLVFKTENMNLSKPMFIRTFKEYSRPTIRHPESIYYLIAMHVLGYLEGEYTPSFFNKIPQELISKINIVFQNEDRFIIYRLDVLREMVESSSSVMLQVLNQLNTLSTSTIVSDVTDSVKEEIVEVSEDKEEKNVTKYQETPTIEKEKKNIEEDTKTREEIVKKDIITDETITDSKKKYVDDLSKKYKEIKVGDKTVQEIIETPVDKKLNDNAVSDEIKESLPEESLSVSSISNFSQEYMEKSFKQDMINTFVSFSKQGMYLQNIEEKDKDDKLSKLTEYKVTFKDKTGRQHTIKFTLPKVDENGNCYINGVYKRMSLQRINTPICKVSPTRVSLSSNYNKTIVERNESFSNSFDAYIKRIFSKTDKVKTDLGHNSYPNKKLPYEYSSLARSFNSISGKEFHWHFIVDNRFDGMDENEKNETLLLEQKYGIYFGKTKNSKSFLNYKGVMTLILGENEVINTSILNTLKQLLPDSDFPHFNEWVNLNILNKSLPVIFVLLYRFGLEYMLKYLNVKHEFHIGKKHIQSEPSDVLIRFEDGILAIYNPTMVARLLFSGLSSFSFKNIPMHEMNNTDIYYDLMQSKKLSVNYLKGINDMFEMFIDPITEDVLRQMGEPTNLKDLLIRATALLSTEDFNEAASSSNFRYRSYERFNAIIYNHMARALTTYKNKAVGHNNKFSISEYDIISAISTDPLLENIDIINPVGDLKARHRYSHIGEGGRTSESLVIRDRRYPNDGVGIISEATSDSIKVGIDGILSSNPSIVNIRGMCSIKDINEKIEASELLSPPALLIPGADMDD